MPSHYRRKPGSRRYIDYSIKDLEECLTAIRSKLLTQRAAAEKYNIPRSTIKNKLSHKFNSKPGRPAVFTQEEEKAFAAHLTALSEYGFPLTDIDLRIIIKDFLESQGRIVAIFKNNIPGRDWVLACSANNIVTGDHVLVTWNSRKYPGQILSTNQEGAFVSCLKRGKSFWRWPMIKDEQLYSWDRVVCKIKDPKLMKKGCFSIPEMDNPQ